MKRRPTPTGNPSGFSLVELVLTMTLVGILAMVGALAWSPVMNSWSAGTLRTEAVQSGSYALGRMTGEILQVQNETSVTTANANTFAFTDVFGNAITYTLAGDLLLRNGQTLARGVQALVFNYWDVNEVALPTPQVSPAATDIWRIEVILSLQAANEVVSLSGEVRPRNFPRS